MSKKETSEAKELFERAQEALAKAEENFTKSFNKAVKEFAERAAEVQAEAKRRFDEAMELVGSKEHDAMARVSAVRETFEEKVEQGTEAFWSALGLATRSELLETQRKLKALDKRLKELEGKKPAARRSAEA